MTVCNTAARWEECGGKEYEYHAWRCAYYKAEKYAELLYSSDGNYTTGLSKCFSSYLSQLEDFKDYTYHCELAD